MRIRIHIVPALVAPILLAGCGDRGPRVPVSLAYPAAVAPVVLGEGLTEYPTPAESLFVYEATEVGGDVSLLFHRGRGTSLDEAGRAYIPDPSGSRVLVVGPDLEVDGVRGGPAEAGGGLTQPLSAAPSPDGTLFITDAETAPGLFYYEGDGTYAGASAPPVVFAEIRVGTDGNVWAARSPYVLRFDETAAGEPLLFRFDPLSGEGVGIATIEPVADPSWNRVANAGPIAVGDDGVAYFAFFLRNEVRAYSPAGELMWRTKRGLIWDSDDPVSGPMRPVTQAMSMGPDRLLYVLTVPDTLPELSSDVTPSQGGRRIEVYEPETGALKRAATVPAAWSTFAVDRHGAIYHVDPEAVESTAPAPERRPLPQVTLTSFDADTARFSDWAGTPLLVNFWASWCAPCERELPQLKAYYNTLDHDRVEFIGISADDTRGAAVDFIEPFDLPYPQFFGGLEMQDDFGFFGLPYTIVVDARGRIVEEVFGFGNPETWEYLKGVLEEEMARMDTAATDEAAGAAVSHEHD
jgi:cytochrome c biogenesis protein CcmG/thiol:disulfide interchange protein DsbE